MQRSQLGAFGIQGKRKGNASKSLTGIASVDPGQRKTETFIDI